MQQACMWIEKWGDRSGGGLGQVFGRWLLRLMALVVLASAPMWSAAQSSGSGKEFSNEQLDQMLAQIALYPDSLLSQVLMAATYPDEFSKAAAWSKSHPDAKGNSAVKMVESQSWDPSVQSLVAFPQVLITLAEKPDYVRNVGDAFLGQPDAVMDSVQRLRAAAQKAGNLKSNEQIRVSTAAATTTTTTTTVVQGVPVATQTIVIEPAQPTVVYVPAYNPTYVYGPWWYPSYPPYYYPYPPGYWFSAGLMTGIGWGIGIGITNALWGGFDWGRRDVDININRYNNIHINNRIDIDKRSTSWKHNPEHRRNTPYRGGDASRQRFERDYKSAERSQFRGHDGDHKRDGRANDRDRAAKAMQDHGIASSAGAARKSATKVKSGERDAARAKAQNADRSAAKRRAAQQTQQRGDNHVLKGAGSQRAGQEADRGAKSRAAAQHKRPEPRVGHGGRRGE